MHTDLQKHKPAEAANFLGVTPQTLAVWRSTGRYNLPFLKMGSRIYYLESDLRKFMESRRIEPAAR